MPHAYVLVLTTMPAGDAAEALARALVDERLAACVHVMPVMQSVYRWEGSVHRDAEQQLAIKTTRARLAALEARIAALHPYDVPELVVLPIEHASAAYGAWLAASVEDAP